jgi:hypothetical protein
MSPMWVYLTSDMRSKEGHVSILAGCIQGDGVHAGSRHLLEDVRPEIRHGKAEGVKLARAVTNGEHLNVAWADGAHWMNTRWPLRIREYSSHSTWSV